MSFILWTEKRQISILIYTVKWLGYGAPLKKSRYFKHNLDSRVSSLAVAAMTRKIIIYLMAIAPCGSIAIESAPYRGSGH